MSNDNKLYEPEEANKKIIKNKNNNNYIMFYSPSCGYSMKALELLKNKNVKFKAYKIEKINGSLNGLLNSLNNNHLLDNYNSTNNTIHRTKPLIFYQGNFIGGYNELFKRFI